MTVRSRVTRPSVRLGTGVTCVCAMLAALAGHAAFSARIAADARYTREASGAFQRKIQAIVQQGGEPSPTSSGASTAARTTSKRALQTSLSENELNSYLRYDLRSQIPAGVAEPTITILGDGRLSASAVVDLDAVRASRQSTSWFDPVRLLSGKVPVTASGVLQTEQGTGRFLLESADISGIPVPKGVLQQVVGYYSRSAQNPSGVNLDDAFELPARIREIRVQPGQAIVIQ